VKPYLEKYFTKVGMVEWLKVKSQSSSPSTTKKKKSEAGHAKGRALMEGGG
jgi:hypothetical protein